MTASLGITLDLLWRAKLMRHEDKQQLYEMAEKLLTEQNFPAAVIAGAVAAILAAIAYGVATAMLASSYVFAPVGVGIAVGQSMLYLGRGIETRFGVVASVYTIAGCILGDVCRAVLDLASRDGTSLVEVLGSVSPPFLIGQTLSNISFIDLVFWFVAVFAAVFLARRSLSRTQRLAIGMYARKMKSRSLP